MGYLKPKIKIIEPMVRSPKLTNIHTMIWVTQSKYMQAKGLPMFRPWIFNACLLLLLMPDLVTFRLMCTALNLMRAAFLIGSLMRSGIEISNSTIAVGTFVHTAKDPISTSFNASPCILKKFNLDTQVL